MQLSAYDINEIVLSGKSFAIIRLPGEKKIRVKSGSWERISLDKINKDCFFVQPFYPNEKGFALTEQSEKLFWYEPVIPETSDKKIYKAVFSKFHSQIQKGKFKKLVLSKVKKGSSKKINIGNTFFSLCEKFPKAAVNLIHIPGEGLWMGASPELLLKSDLKNTESMSLAGTMKTKQKKWTGKELEEQKIVTDYIYEKFKKVTGSGTILKQKTIKAGNVNHLCNIFHAKKNISWKKLTNLVNELHPTPAVGGLPKNTSVLFIMDQENHSREFYAGYFGFVEPGKKAEFYVNIRCMKIISGVPYIFTGGGITNESNDLEEWNETELKAQGLINSLSFGEN